MPRPHCRTATSHTPAAERKQGQRRGWRPSTGPRDPYLPVPRAKLTLPHLESSLIQTGGVKAPAPVSHALQRGRHRVLGTGRTGGAPPGPGRFPEGPAAGRRGGFNKAPDLRCPRCQLWDVGRGTTGTHSPKGTVCPQMGLAHKRGRVKETITTRGQGEPLAGPAGNLHRLLESSHQPPLPISWGKLRHRETQCLLNQGQSRCVMEASLQIPLNHSTALARPPCQARWKTTPADHVGKAQNSGFPLCRPIPQKVSSKQNRPCLWKCRAAGGPSFQGVPHQASSPGGCCSFSHRASRRAGRQATLPDPRPGQGCRACSGQVGVPGWGLPHYTPPQLLQADLGLSRALLANSPKQSERRGQTEGFGEGASAHNFLAEWSLRSQGLGASSSCPVPPKSGSGG